MADEEAIQKAVEEAKAGLLKKNKELMAEVKEAKAALSKFDGVDLDALKTASDELKTLKTKKLEADGEYKKMYEQLKAEHSTTLSKLEAERDALKGDLSDTKKVYALTLALNANKAIPKLVDVAVTTLKDQVALDDNGVAMVGDKTVTDFVKSWTQSDVGKYFVQSGNSGGGGDGSGDVKLDPAAKFFDKKSPHFNLTEQGKIAKVDPARYTKLKEAHS